MGETCVDSFAISENVFAAAHGRSLKGRRKDENQRDGIGREMGLVSLAVLLLGGIKVQGKISE